MKLLIRADASPEIGTGHVMRCLALAQVCIASGGAVELACRLLPERLAERLQREGLVVHRLANGSDREREAAALAAVATATGAQWVVVDGYRFDAAYQEALQAAGLRVLFIDDYGHAGRYPAQIVLDQNIGTTRQLYSAAKPTTRFLLGPRYILLRREFSLARQAPRHSGRARRVLVTLGGADPQDLTHGVVEALADLPDLEIKVAVGAAMEDRRHPDQPDATTIEFLVDPPDMRELMEWADLAVSAAGSTLYELAFVGVPTVGIVTAENQLKVAEGLRAAGVLVSLGWHEQIGPAEVRAAVADLLADPAARARMATRGRTLVDGRGAQRVCAALREDGTTLRDAGPEDSRRLWEWASDRVVRAASFSPEPIPWQSHREWLAAKLADPSCHIFVGLDDRAEPLGQIRFECDAISAAVDVHLAPGRRGQGLGSALIRHGCERLFAQTDVDEIHALVKVDNEASRQAFLRAGFDQRADETREGTPVHLFTLERS